MATPEQVMQWLLQAAPGLAVGLERILRLGPQIEKAEKSAAAALQASADNAIAIKLLEQAHELADDEVAARRADAGPGGLSSAEVENVVRRIVGEELRDIRREHELIRAAAARDMETWADFKERFGVLCGRIEHLVRASL